MVWYRFKINLFSRWNLVRWKEILSMKYVSSGLSTNIIKKNSKFFLQSLHQNYVICWIAIFGMTYFQRTVAKSYFAEWLISKQFVAESRLQNIIALRNFFFVEWFFAEFVFCGMLLRNDLHSTKRLAKSAMRMRNYKTGFPIFLAWG